MNGYYHQGATRLGEALGTIRGDLESDNKEKVTIEDLCCANLIHASDSYKAYLSGTQL